MFSRSTFLWVNETMFTFMNRASGAWSRSGRRTRTTGWCLSMIRFSRFLVSCFLHLSPVSLVSTALSLHLRLVPSLAQFVFKPSLSVCSRTVSLFGSSWIRPSLRFLAVLLFSFRDNSQQKNMSPHPPPARNMTGPLVEPMFGLSLQGHFRNMVDSELTLRLY